MVDGVVAGHSTDAFLGHGRFDLLIEAFTSGDWDIVTTIRGE